MSAILCIYSEEPVFPATDQHPEAVRYIVGGHIVDAVGGEPSLAQLNEHLWLALSQAADAALQNALDLTAQSWGYMSIISATSYVGDPCARFNAEAVALRDWRSAVWVWAADAQAQIASGAISMPSSVDDFIAGMPPAPVRPIV